MVWVYGRKSSKKPLGLKTIGNLGLEMAIGLDFGRIIGVGPQPLVIHFPPFFDRFLFAYQKKKKMAADKFTTMAESWNRFDNRGGWVLNCVRAFNDWEVDLVANLLFVLQKERASTELDNVTWKGATNATFSVRNAYILLAPNSGALFHAKSIWVPSTLKWPSSCGKRLGARF